MVADKLLLINTFDGAKRDFLSSLQRQNPFPEKSTLVNIMITKAILNLEPKSSSIFLNNFCVPIFRAKPMNNAHFPPKGEINSYSNE